MSKYGGANAEKSPYFSVLHHFEEYNAELIFSNANLQNLISFKRFQAGKHAVDAEVEKTEKGLHHNDYSTCKPWSSHVKTFEGNAYNPGNAYKEKERLEKTSLDGGAYGARSRKPLVSKQFNSPWKPVIATVSAIGRNYQP